MQSTPQTKVSILRLKIPSKLFFIVGLCLFSMCGNVKCLKTAGFSACEFERSENEQVEKPADFQAYASNLVIINLFFEYFFFITIFCLLQRETYFHRCGDRFLQIISFRNLYVL
jgi:hypothetical protein